MLTLIFFSFSCLFVGSSAVHIRHICCAVVVPSWLTFSTMKIQSKIQLGSRHAPYDVDGPTLVHSKTRRDDRWLMAFLVGMERHSSRDTRNFINFNAIMTDPELSTSLQGKSKQQLQDKWKDLRRYSNPTSIQALPHEYQLLYHRLKQDFESHQEAKKKQPTCHKPKHPAVSRQWGNGFEAVYNGRCAMCKDKVMRGETISKDRHNNAYAHATCVAKAFSVGKYN